MTNITGLVNGGAMLKNNFPEMADCDRFTGGPNTCILTAKHDKAFLGLGRNNGGEKAARGLSGALFFQLRPVTRDFNHPWYAEAMDHSIRARCSEPSVVSFDLVEMEASDASIQ